MGRRYYVDVSSSSMTTSVADVLNITATANMAFKVLRISGGQTTLTTTESKAVALKRMPATVTAGSGGGAVTIRKQNFGDAAPTITARSLDTTGMTTSGTPEILLARNWELLNGFDHVFTPGSEPIINPSQGAAFSIVAALSNTTTVSFTIEVEELF
jgi:hypothetical protein